MVTKSTTKAEESKKEREGTTESEIAGTESNDKNEQEDEDVSSLISAAQKQLKLDDGDDTTKKYPLALRRLASWIQTGQAKNIIVVCGAGISVAAGIPDFRSPGTGLYDNLQKYDLPYAEAIFDVQYYAHKPQAFCQLAHELWPGLGKYQPTLTHSFLALLDRKGLLMRNYSQNIDGLEFLAGLSSQKLVECHGHFRTASCIKCGKKADIECVKKTMVEQEGQVPKCSRCKSNVKPDIVFFGESLPPVFFRNLQKDLKQADVCLILGTSLQVAPVSMLPQQVRDSCKRVLLNRERVGSEDFEFVTDNGNKINNNKNEDCDVCDKNARDYFCAGDVDDSVRQLAELLGWEAELIQHHEAVSSLGQKQKKKGER